MRAVPVTPRQVMFTVCGRCPSLHAEGLTVPFGYPRLDNCEKCDSLKLKMELKLEKETKNYTNRALKVEQKLHLSKAQQFYSNLRHIHDMTSPLKVCVVITSRILHSQY